MIYLIGTNIKQKFNLRLELLGLAELQVFHHAR